LADLDYHTVSPDSFTTPTTPLFLSLKQPETSIPISTKHSYTKSMFRLLHNLTQPWTPPSNPTNSFVGKTIIVTDANARLGFEAALKLVQLNASLAILAVRDLDKRDEARKEILSMVAAGGREV
jgi:hypothetical protein